jgi:general secretion pathway protein J
MTAATARRRPQPGFTLVELLVALLIFGLLSAAGAGLLRFGVDARQRTGERLDRLASIVRTRALLTADLAQAAPRVWRDNGGASQPAFASDGTRLALVRRGWSNDAGAARASLQRVEYRLAADRLERSAAPMLDGSEWGPPALLIGGVGTMRLRFFADGAWRDRWDPLAANALPEAVELTLGASGVPEIRQLFLVGPGDERVPPR